MPTRSIIKALSDPDWEVRRRAVMVIGREKDQEGFPFLVQLLADEDADVCQAAVLSMARLGNPQAIPHLLRMHLLEHIDPEVRKTTVQALGRFHDLRMVEALLHALEDTDWSVRIAAEEIMVGMADEIVKDASPESARRLVRILSTSNKVVYERASRAFSELGELGFSLLEDHLFLYDLRSRVGITRALSYFPGEQPVPHLIKLLDDQRPEVRLSVVRALSGRRSLAALNPLIKCLTDFRRGVARAAVSTLASYGERCVRRLEHVLDRTSSPRLKRAILAVFSLIAMPSCVIPAVNHLNSLYYEVRLNAIEVLEKAGQPSLRPVIDMLERQTWFSSSLLKRVMIEKNKRLKLRLIRAIGELKDARALPVLKDLLRSADGDIRGRAHDAAVKIHRSMLGRYSALVVLQRLNHPRCLPALRRLIRSEDEPKLKVIAINIIEELGDEKSRKMLLDILRSSDEFPDVRAAAVDALKVLGASTVVTDLIAVLEDESDLVVRKAVRALGNCVYQDVVPELIERMKTAEGQLLNDIQLAVANFGDDPVPGILEALESAPPPEAFKLLDTFYLIAGDQLKQYLKRYRIPPDIFAKMAGRNG